MTQPGGRGGAERSAQQALVLEDDGARVRRRRLVALPAWLAAAARFPTVPALAALTSAIAVPVPVTSPVAVPFGPGRRERRAQHGRPVERQIRMRVLERFHHLGIEEVPPHLAVRWRAEHVEKARTPAVLALAGPESVHHKGG